jgi:hypothetical protein
MVVRTIQLPRKAASKNALAARSRAIEVAVIGVLTVVQLGWLTALAYGTFRLL